jgi:small ligand-binding sensory domain FIST
VSAVVRFASALSRHPVASHAIGECAGTVLEALDAEDPDLLVCFASPHFVGAFDDMTAALRDLLDPMVMLGMTAVSVIGDAHEIEDEPAFSLLAARLPDARLTPASLTVEATPDGDAVVGWPELDGDPGALVLLADPFSFPLDGFLHRLQDDLPDLSVIGGVASAGGHLGGNRLVLDDHVTDRGAVGVFVDGVEVRTVVSQGCRPIGQPYTGTSADRTCVEVMGG